MKFLLPSAAVLLPLVSANDPSPGWLSYVTYTDPQDRRITRLATNWTVPARPTAMFGSNAPGWWFGIQTKDGDGALVQPILAWGYQGDEFTIFDACFDWTDESWHTSDQMYTVKPGDYISSEIVYVEESNSYDMFIQSQRTGNSVKMNYKIQEAQHKNESQAYFVFEHQPDRCKALPADGACTFEHIYLEVDGQEVKDVAWESKQETPKCNSKATVEDPQTIKFTWDASDADDSEVGAALPEPSKWGSGATDVPVLPSSWTADVVAKSSGTFPGVPHATQSFTEYHDYTNKRRRLDFKDQYYTKIYRYDVESWDHQPFPAPKGYKIHLDAQGNPDPMDCCWLWLVDSDTGDNEKMAALQLPAKSEDQGSTTIDGVTVESWGSHTILPFPTSDDWFLANGSIPVQWNSFAKVGTKGTIIGNSSYTNFVAGPIPNETFAVPDSRPTFGKCKQCGVDPECPMQECMS